MDLFIGRGPRGLLVSRSDIRWTCSSRGGCIVAIFPGLGQFLDHVQRAVAADERGWTAAPLPCVLAAVAHADLGARDRSRSPRRCDECCEESESEESDSYCSDCRRARETSPPPPPNPAAPRLTDQALAQLPE
jgi:hypothetical protein